MDRELEPLRRYSLIYKERSRSLFTYPSIVYRIVVRMTFHFAKSDNEAGRSAAGWNPLLSTSFPAPQLGRWISTIIQWTEYIILFRRVTEWERVYFDVRARDETRRIIIGPSSLEF